MQKAYFRELRHSKQCELVFPLKVLGENGTIILDEDIHAVRQCSDNIHSLLEHIKNKIKKLLDGKGHASMNIDIAMTKQGIDIKGDTECRSLILQRHRDIKFTILEQSFEVVMNAPLIHSIVLPSVLYVDYILQPIRFRAIHAEKKKCEYVWFKSVDQISWMEVGYTYKYKPTKQDLGHYLKFLCTPKNVYVKGPSYEVVSKTTVQLIQGIPDCPFQKRHLHTINKPTDDEFRILSYNILSDLYTDNNSYFPYCSPEALSIDYRKQLILKELLGYNADIMCLQEVDHLVYLNYFKTKFKNYRGIFHRKGNRIPEGLACFFNPARFKLLEAKQLVYSEELRSNQLFLNIWKLIKQGNNIKECIAKQPTSLQITVLKLKETNKILIVANTHLYYHSEANDIRLLQTLTALEYIKDVIRNYKRSYRNSTIGVIFCGDFNSIPTSTVYKFCSEGNITHTFEAESRTPLLNIDLKHQFAFASAYGTPLYTNYTDSFKGCLDYIFYEQSNLHLMEVVPLPEETILSERTALPNDVFPSDHLALVASFKFL